MFDFERLFEGDLRADLLRLFENERRSGGLFETERRGNVDRLFESERRSAGLFETERRGDGGRLFESERQTRDLVAGCLAKSSSDALRTVQQAFPAALLDKLKKIVEEDEVSGPICFHSALGAIIFRGYVPALDWIIKQDWFEVRNFERIGVAQRKDDEDRSYRPLHYAVICEEREIMLRLLDAGCNPNIGDTKNKSGPLQFACEYCHVFPLYALLLNERLDPTNTNKSDTTALHAAATSLDDAPTSPLIPLCVLLHLYGDDRRFVNAKNQWRQTPIHCLTNTKYHHETFMARFFVLLCFGADPNLEDMAGDSALSQLSGEDRARGKSLLRHCTVLTKRRVRAIIDELASNILSLAKENCALRRGESPSPSQVSTEYREMVFSMTSCEDDVQKMMMMVVKSLAGETTRLVDDNNQRRHGSHARELLITCANSSSDDVLRALQKAFETKILTSENVWQEMGSVVKEEQFADGLCFPCPFSAILERGHLSVLDWMMQQNWFDLGRFERMGIACRQDDTERAYRALHYAAICEKPELFMRLLSAGCNPLIGDTKCGKTPMIHACAYGTPFYLYALLLHDAGASKVADCDGDTPLHYAAWSTENPSCSPLITVCLLLHICGDDVQFVNAMNKQRQTPLHRLSRYKQHRPSLISRFFVLICFGADPKKKDTEDKSPISLLTDAEREAAILLLTHTTEGFKRVVREIVHALSQNVLRLAEEHMALRNGESPPPTEVSNEHLAKAKHVQEYGADDFSARLNDVVNVLSDEVLRLVNENTKLRADETRVRVSGKDEDVKEIETQETENRLSELDETRNEISRLMDLSTERDDAITRLEDEMSARAAAFAQKTKLIAKLKAQLEQKQSGDIEDVKETSVVEEASEQPRRLGSFARAPSELSHAFKFIPIDPMQITAPCRPRHVRLAMLDMKAASRRPQTAKGGHKPLLKYIEVQFETASEGSDKRAYAFYDTDSQRYWAKQRKQKDGQPQPRFRHDDWTDDEWEHRAASQFLKDISENFFEQEDFHEITGVRLVNHTRAVVVQSSDTRFAVGEYMWVEADTASSAESSKFFKVDDPQFSDKRVPPALSVPRNVGIDLEKFAHYSFHWSNGTMLLRDVQGSWDYSCQIIKLTDPSVWRMEVYEEKRKIGGWFHNHDCVTCECNTAWKRPKKGFLSSTEENARPAEGGEGEGATL